MSAKNSYEVTLDDLPDDWDTIPIVGLGKVVSGGTPSRDVPTFWGGEISWVTPGELTGIKSKHIGKTVENITPDGLNGSGATLLPKDSLLITTRATLGARAINSTPMATNQGFKSIVFKNPTDADYYYYWTEKLAPELIRRASGTTFLEISGSQFCEINVPNPPEPERIRIAKILDTLDTQIRQTEALIAKLERIKRGLLTDLLTRGIDQNGQLRPTPDQAPHLYKDSPLGRIPRDWDIDSLDGLSEKSAIGPFGSDLVATDYREEGVPVVFVRDVKASGFEWNSETYVTDEKALALSAHEVRAGDILLTKMGLPPCVACIYPAWMPNGVITADIIRLRPRKDRVSAHWVMEYVNSEHVARQVRAITAGVTRPKVTLGDARNILIAAPPVDEQKRILEALANSLNEIVTNKQELTCLVMIKSGLMDDLLTGRVRVTPLLGDTKPQQAGHLNAGSGAHAPKGIMHHDTL